MPVKVVALVTVKPGEEDAFTAAARTCVAATRAEAGVLHYDLWREADGERRFVVQRALCRHDAAVQAHMASETTSGVRPQQPRPRVRSPTIIAPIWSTLIGQPYRLNDRPST